MPRRPNYGQERALRNRIARERTAEKLKARQERSEQRKMEQELQADEDAGAPDQSIGTTSEPR